uniref:DUF7812 domain-containing protein n=1 Tax=Arundo donax TaxID=35708 RepID=A0A0A9GHZ5_ARUDO
MPDVNGVEAARRLATLALEELSRHDATFSTPPPYADLPALLRRCLRLLPLLDAGDPRLAARCVRRLLATLRGIVSRDPSPSLLPALEVFTENLVTSDQLRSCFAMADSAAPEGSRVFTVAPLCRGDLHTVLELVCCHFISSLEDEGGFGLFLSAISWLGNASVGAPEIGLRGALALIYRTCLFSLPAVVQAHLLLLTSRCISGPDLDSHLLAFEHSMNLYVTYLPALGAFNRTRGVENPLSFLAKKMPFVWCVKDATTQKLKSQINGLLLFCQSHSGDDLPSCESDIFGSTDRLIQENQHMLHEKFRQEATSVVKSILSEVLHCAKQKEMHESDAEVSEEIICLTAVLRLMGSLLLQILHCFSQMRAVDDMENVNHIASCKEYILLCETIFLLGQYEANELHIYDLIGIIRKPVDRERASLVMLAHFACLSVCCVRRRLGFLWKGCIIMMMMAMNLVIAEEKNMDMFQVVIDVSKESAVFPDTKEGNLKVCARRSSKVMALSLGTLQSPRVEKANGQAFFDCHPEYIPGAWNDITDFVECKQGRDYSSYLVQRKRFKDFRDGKYLSTKLPVKKIVTEEILSLKKTIRKKRLSGKKTIRTRRMLRSKR